MSMFLCEFVCLSLCQNAVLDDEKPAQPITADGLSPAICIQSSGTEIPG